MKININDGEQVIPIPLTMSNLDGKLHTCKAHIRKKRTTKQGTVYLIQGFFVLPPNAEPLPLDSLALVEVNITAISEEVKLLHGRSDSFVLSKL